MIGDLVRCGLQIMRAGCVFVLHRWLVLCMVGDGEVGANQPGEVSEVRGDDERPTERADVVWFEVRCRRRRA
jgi:hypothetical protein